MLAASNPARAQVPPAAPAAGGDRFHLDLRSRATYDSNVAGGDQTIQNLRDVEPNDVTFDFGASVSYQVPTARRTLFFNGSADVRRHTNNSNLNGEDFNTAAGIVNQFGRCSLTAIGSYSRLQALPADLTIAVTKNVVDQRSANASLACGQRGLTASISGGVIDVDNHATGPGFVDSSTVNAAVAVGYSNDILGNLSLTGQYAKGSYDSPAAPASPLLASGFKQYGGGLSYGRKIGRRLNGTAAASYTRIESEGVAGSSSGLSADVALDYAFSQRLSFGVAYSLGNHASRTLDADYVRTESGSLRANYRLNSRISLQTSFAASRDHSKGGLATTFQVRDNKQYNVAAGATWRFGRNLNLSLDASHTDRTADLPQFNFKADRVSLGLAASF